MNALAAPLLAGGPPGWVLAGVVTVIGLGLVAVASTSQNVEDETAGLDDTEERARTCGDCRRDENGNEIISEDRARHILNGDRGGGGHRAGTGKPGKTEFPPDWSDDEILDAISDVAQNGNVIRPAHRPGEVVKAGNVRGVDIETIVRPDGPVRTGYPTGGAGVVRNPQ